MISERDNVATALQPLEPGQTSTSGGDAVTVERADRVADTRSRCGESPSASR